MKYFLIFGMLMLIGCKVTRDNKSLARVIASTDLSARAYNILVKQHPITIDTLIKIVNGKPVISYDTIEKPIYYTDTLIDLQPGKIKTIERLITKNITVNDTIIKTVQDSRLLDAANTVVTTLQTQLQSSKDGLTQAKKSKTYWVIGACVSFLLFLLMIFALLKKK